MSVVVGFRKCLGLQFSSIGGADLSPFYLLPDELVLRIFSELESRELEVCKLVCKRWNDLHYYAFRKLAILRSVGLDDVEHALRSFPNLRSVSVRNLNGEGLDRVLKSISRHCKALTEFRYENFQLPEGVELCVRQVLASNPNVQTFSFRCNHLEFSVDALNLSSLTKLKDFEFESRVIKQVPLTNQQMENISKLKFIHRSFTPSHCISKMFTSENWDRWKNLKALSLNSLPNDLDMIGRSLRFIPALESLNLYFSDDGTNFETFDLGCLPGLNRLKLHCPGCVKNYAPGLSNMKNLESLTLSSLTNLEWIPVLTELRKLQTLSLEISSYVEGEDSVQNLKIVEDLVQLRNLSLRLYGCSFAFESIEKLVNLQSLTLYARGSKECSIKHISKLKALRSLQISFRRIGNGFVDLNLNDLAHLEFLSLQCFHGGLAAFDMLTWDLARCLKTVVLKCDQAIDAHISWIGSLESLEYLELDRSDIKAFPKSVFNLKSLRVLRLDNFSKLKSLVFPRVCTLLNTLILRNMASIKHLDDRIYDLKFLHTLEITCCPQLILKKQHTDKFKSLNLSIDYGCFE